MERSRKLEVFEHQANVNCSRARALRRSAALDALRCLCVLAEKRKL
jgi:hypothetical protein